MKYLLVLGLGVTAGITPADVVLQDASHGAKLIYDRKTEDGKIVESEVWSGSMTSRIVRTSYTEAGQLTNCMVAITRGRASSRTEATITPGGAVVTSTARNGTGPASSIPIGRRMTIADPSVKWFVKDHPEKGTSATFMSFDAEFRYWEEITVTFEGRGKLGDSPEGNLVTRKTARSTIHLLLDDKGMPFVWEEGRLRLVRETGK